MTRAILSPALAALLCSSCLLTAIPEEMLSGGKIDASSAADAVVDSATADRTGTDRIAGDAARPDGVSPDRSGQDLNGVDLAQPDTAGPERWQADAAVADSWHADTAAGPDQRAPDTAVPDSQIADQARPDLAQPDRSGVDAGSNTPPIAIARFVPAVGTTSTVFTTSTTGTSDREDSVSSLVFRWDWNRDGTYDATGATQTHTFAALGRYEVLLDVADTGGLHTQALVVAEVVDASALIEVTTSVDENDAGATPGAPGNAGLSLREAITYVNGQGGSRTIYVRPNLTIALSSGLPAVTASNVTLVSGTGSVVDGAAIGNQNCLTINADNFEVDGLTLRSCLATALEINGNNARVTRCQFLQDRRALDVPPGSGRTSLAVGPGNLFAQSLSYAIQTGVPAQVIGNVVRDNTADYGVRLLDAAAGTLIAQNVFRGNLSAVGVLGSATGSRIVNNVIDGQTDWAVLIGARASTIELKNNVFTGNFNSSVINDGGRNASIQYNDLFGNVGSACTCGAIDGTNKTYDPRYVNATGDDMRLQPDSQLINAGTDLGIDVNGPLPGNFNGSAPDIGAYEAP